MHAVLAAQSHFSIGQSTLSVEDLIEAAKTTGAKAVALTDTMSVTGLIDFTNRAGKAGIKPIVGCRLTLLDHADLTWRKTAADKKGPREYGLIAYVLSEAGLKALFRLLSLANSDERFYHHARLSFDDLYAELDTLPADSLAIASGGAYSAIQHADAAAIFQNIAAAVSPRNAFLSLTPVDTPYWDAMNARAIAVHQKLLGVGHALPFLVARPAQYAAPSLDPKEAMPADSAEIVGAICNNRRLSDPWHPKNQVRDFQPRRLDELARDVVAASHRLKERHGIEAGTAFREGMVNTETLTNAVTWTWSKAPVSLPTMAPDEFAAVQAACVAGWKARFSDIVFGHKPDFADPAIAKVYKDRLAFELLTLKRLNFSGYFLLVQDVVVWAKSQGILVGPGRGSVGGSLVAYLMGITDCDPIRFELLFERFINPERLDLPDADLDFMSARRGEVIDYLIGKYGAARVAGISNFGTLGPASAIRDVGKALGMSEDMVACSKTAPKLHGANVPLPKAADLAPEIGRFRDAYPTVWPHCVALEGVMRNLGRHAAGVVVGGCDLVERAVVERRKDGATINWDKRISEDMGLVKLDVLGLNTLDLIALTLSYIKERTGKTIDVNKIALDDAPTLEMIGDGSTTGVFQFDSGSPRRLLKNMAKLSPLNFNDLIAVNALNRPGPLEAGLADSYTRRRNGEEAVEYPHAATKEALKDTYGVLVYQEQLMRISRDLCGFTGAEADVLRKAVGKKDAKLMAAQKDKFLKGAIAGTIEITLDDGAVVEVNRAKRFRVAETKDLKTVEEIFSEGLTLAEKLG